MENERKKKATSDAGSNRGSELAGGVATSLVAKENKTLRG